MINKEEIIRYLRDNRQIFLEKYSVDSFMLFGSFARDENRDKSDIDIVYSLKKGAKLNFDKYLELEKELQKAFGKKVDLINQKKLNPLVKLNATKDFIYV